MPPPIGNLGPWMNPAFDARQIPADLREPVIHYMLEQFGELQARLEQQHERIVYVRTQGTLSRNEWGDEIHPTAAGFRKIGDLIYAAMQTKFPTLP
jgi:hypothetical protein